MIALVPATSAVAQAVVGFARPDLPHVPDWPHEDSYDALRPLADHGDAPGTFLVLEDGLVVGDCGWFGPPTPDGEVEIGYGLAPSARGRGVGTTAVRLLLDWVTLQGATAVRACVLPGNEASLRLLTALGFAEAGEVEGHRVLTRSLP